LPSDQRGKLVGSQAFRLDPCSAGIKYPKRQGNVFGIVLGSLKRLLSAPMSLPQKELYEFGPFAVDPADRTALRNGTPLAMTPKVFDTLVYLLRNRGRLLSKDELLKGIWPDAFVEEVNLAVNISTLRKLFGEGPQDGRYIVTVPGSGYRFVAEVSVAVGEPGPVESGGAIPADGSSGVSIDDLGQTESNTQTVSRGKITKRNPRSKNLWFGAAATVVVLLALALLYNFRRSRLAPGLTAQDSILLADFENSTGEPVLDDTLKEGVTVNLGQSPFLNLIANDRVRETLRFMGRSPDERVESGLAREICQRAGAKAMVSGTVSRLGSSYVVAVEAATCADGTTIAREQVAAKNKEALLPALSGATARLRGKLGESLGSVERFGVPIEQATTPSLEALKSYSIGLEQHRRGAEKDAIPFFTHAIELDPHFAMAFARRGSAYHNLGETTLASEDFRKAYALRANLSERENLYLTVRHQDATTSDTTRSIETYELWSRLYPRDLQPFNGLAARYQIVGDYGKALRAGEQALQLNPDNYVPYANLATTYEALGRFDEAKRICERAASAKRDSSYTHRVLYEIAFLRNDREAIQHEADIAAGTDREDEMFSDQAFALAAIGKLRQARQLFQRVWSDYERKGLHDHAAYLIAREGLIEADFGNYAEAKSLAEKSISLGKGIDAQATVAEVLSLSKRQAEARALADALHQHFPQHAPLNSATIPTILAAAALQDGNSQKALELLEQARPYDFSEFSNLAPVYIRGQAYLRSRSGAGAAAEFQKLLDHQGIDAASPRHALAELGLARSYAMQGDIAKSSLAYKHFLSTWAEADSDLPILRQAKLELSSLN
jgi:eukaryotic-like serine/threonine-protein kinase